MPQLQIDIPEDVNAGVSEALDCGEFASQSDIVTAALRLLLSERLIEAVGADSIRAKWDEAIAANGPYHHPDEILDRLEVKYSAAQRG